jgi:hypothetical protein
MDKDVPHSELSPQEKTIEFWSDTILENGLSRIHKVLSIADESEDYSYSNFIERVMEGKTKKFAMNICYHGFEFQVHVKPFLPQREIDRILEGLPIDKDLLMYILKPIPLEKYLTDEYPKLYRLEQDICREKNRVIKQMAPMLKQMENLRSENILVNSPHLLQTIKEIQYEISCYREIVDRGINMTKKHFAMMLLDKDLKKIDPQKHKFWSKAINAAIFILNEHFHSDSCHHGCKVTHVGTLRTVAELLRALYPTIWNKDADTIYRLIEQRDSRQS